jgi:hypothetical protein
MYFSLPRPSTFLPPPVVITASAKKISANACASCWFQVSRKLFGDCRNGTPSSCAEREGQAESSEPVRPRADDAPHRDCQGEGSGLNVIFRNITTLPW